MDPRIGQLNNGQFYAYPHGYNNPPVIGTLDDVKTALGLIDAKTN